MAEMTLEQYQAKIKAQIKALDDNAPLFIMASSMLSSMVRRIFVDGKNAAGASIGTYSTNPTFINAPEFGTARFFEGGYKEFRKSIGREDAFVNLRLTNDLQSNISNVLVPSSSNTVAGQPTPIKISNDEYVVRLRPSNVKKVEKLEKQYGKVFEHTKKERDQGLKVARFELQKLLAE